VFSQTVGSSFDRRYGYYTAEKKYELVGTKEQTMASSVFIAIVTAIAEGYQTQRTVNSIQRRFCSASLNHIIIPLREPLINEVIYHPTLGIYFTLRHLRQSTSTLAG